MGKPVNIKVDVEEVCLCDLASGQVIEHSDGFAVKLYDGLISFDLDCRDGDSMVVYSDEELKSTTEFERIRLRDDLRLSIKLEQCLIPPSSN